MDIALGRGFAVRVSLACPLAAEEWGQARARLGQVKWRDPADAEVARRHLDEH